MRQIINNEGSSERGRAFMAGLMSKAIALWPSLPFMALGLWNAWASLAYSGTLWLSDAEEGVSWLFVMFNVSTPAFALVAIAFAVFSRRGANRFVVAERHVVLAGAAATLGSLLIVAMDQVYLGQFLTEGMRLVFFGLGAAATGAGTAVVMLRCGSMYGSLTPRRILINAGLAQLVSGIIYLATLALPRWTHASGGPVVSDVALFVLLPVFSALLACTVPLDGTCGDASPSRGGQPVGNTAQLPTAVNGFARLPSAFWRFVAFAFLMSLLTATMRSSAVAAHDLSTTLEGSNILKILRLLMALVFIAYAVCDRATGEGFGRTCSIFAVFSALVVAIAGVFGFIGDGWSLILYFGTGVFEFLLMCLLAFIVVQKRLNAVTVFGFGRGVYMLGLSFGWMLGPAIVQIVPDGAPMTVVFAGVSIAMLLAALILFSERDYQRLFSPVSEEELSLEDLFDLDQREAEVAAEDRSNKRGRFSRAIEAVAAEHLLSAREAEVLRCLAMGYGSDRTADHLGVKVGTVRTHTHNVYVKLDVHSREELMRLVDDAVACQ